MMWRSVTVPIATLPEFVRIELEALIFRKEFPEGVSVGVVIVPETLTVSFRVSSERVTLQAPSAAEPPSYPDGMIPNIDPVRGY